MAEKVGEDRKIIVTDSLKLPEFSRELPIWNPVILRALRESQFFEGRTQIAMESPQTAEDKIFADGLSSFLMNKNYIVMVLTHYETYFAKPYKNWSDEDWNLVAHNEAQALLPMVQQSSLSGRDIKPIWGESFLQLNPQQRISKVVELLTVFLGQVFSVAVTRTDVKELIKQNRSDTIAPMVSNKPSSKLPAVPKAERDDEFQEYFARVPDDYRTREFEVHYRFECFRDRVVKLFEQIAEKKDLPQDSREQILANIYGQTGIPVEVLRKAYYVFCGEPELVKHPNAPINHILTRERANRVEGARKHLADFAENQLSVADIQKITQGVTNVWQGNAELPTAPTVQVVTKEGLVACVYSHENRIVVRYPRVEYDMHKIFQECVTFLQSLEQSGKEVLSPAAFRKLETKLESETDSVFGAYYAQMAKKRSGETLGRLKANTEGRLQFHGQQISHLATMAEGLRNYANNGFNPAAFQAPAELFRHDNDAWNESMNWLSSTAIVSGDISEEKFALLEHQLNQLTAAKNEMANVQTAKQYFYHLKQGLKAYITKLIPAEYEFAKPVLEASAKLEGKWPNFSSCYDVLTIDEKQDQASKQEFMLWISILSDTLNEQKRQLEQGAGQIAQQMSLLASAMCNSDPSSSVWDLAQKQLVKKFALDEDTINNAWNTWEKNMAKIILSNQVPADKQALANTVLNNFPTSDRAVGRFPKLYPELWYMSPEKYLGTNQESRVPLADAAIITVKTEQGKMEQWQLLYTLGNLKLRRIASKLEGDRTGRAQTMFTSSGE